MRLTATGTSQLEVRMRLTMQQRQAVVAKAASRYQRSRKKEKSLILSELVELTEYSRAYARRVLRQRGQRLKRSNERKKWEYIYCFYGIERPFGPLFQRFNHSRLTI